MLFYIYFYIHFWACHRISAAVSDVTWRHSNNGRHLWKKTESMDQVLADICCASDCKLLFCISQKWYVVVTICLWYLLLMVNCIQ